MGLTKSPSPLRSWTDALPGALLRHPERARHPERVRHPERSEGSFLQPVILTLSEAKGKDPFFPASVPTHMTKVTPDVDLEDAGQ